MAPRSISAQLPSQTNLEIAFRSENHGSIYLLRSVSLVHGAIADGLVVRS
jgi:hypothetical protein